MVFVPQGSGTIHAQDSHFRISIWKHWQVTEESWLVFHPERMHKGLIRCQPLNKNKQPTRPL